MKTVLLVDGNPLCWRSSEIFKGLRTSGGQKTGIVFGALRNLRAAVERYSPDSYYVFFDQGRCRWRRKLFPDYKTSRDKRRKDDPEKMRDLYREMNEFQDLLPLLGIRVIKAKNVEADDLIGLSSEWLETHLSKTDEDVRVVIVGGDRDLWQLITPNVTCYDPVQKKEYTIDDFMLRYGGLEPDQLVDLKALTGDKSDDIPGAAGIGEKTAIKLLQKYGSIQDLLDDATRNDLSKTKRTASIHDQADAIRLSQKLASIPFLDDLNKHEFFDETQKDLIRHCLTQPAEFDRMGFTMSCEAMELYSVVKDLKPFLEIMVPKEDPLAEGFSEVFE